MKKKDISRRSFLKKSTLAVTGTALIPSLLASKKVSAKDANKNKMFCYQCEQTMGGRGCTRIGVCGKTPEIAALQDLLIHTLKGLSIAAMAGRKVNISDVEVNRFTCMAMFSTLTNVEFDPYRFEDLLFQSVGLRDRMIQKVKAAGGTVDTSSDAVTLKLKPTLDGMVKQAKAYGLFSDPDVNPDIRSLQHLLLFGIKGMAAYTDHAAEHDQEDEGNYEYVHRALAALENKSLGADELLALVLECGEKNLRAMELLSLGNSGAYGDPVPTPVPLGAKKGKAILVSGHDLIDLEAVLKASQGKGITVYTHGEMLPAHGYPNLKARFSHFYGHYGTAWQHQRKEFDKFPGAILMTSNCIQKPKQTYKRNIFTTGTVGWPGVTHLSKKNLQPLIDQALELPGYPQDQPDMEVLVGFGHTAVLGVADKIVAGVKDGSIGHFFLVGGCDGVKKSRNYYTEFVEKAPDNSIILTLACGKFKFFKHQLGEINGIPRLLDVGQCNDSHSAVQIAVALTKAFDTDVNGLPLSFIISWYEQKAVAVLLSLLHLGIKDIHLGPSLPAFITPNILDVLVKNYNLTPIGTAEGDLKKILG
ncbi:MAG: hydroxylamine reductase [Desulfobacterium sp.]|nr:hydroxylamine reductase [Desulfobacterium sp.]